MLRTLSRSLMASRAPLRPLPVQSRDLAKLFAGFSVILVACTGEHVVSPAGSKESTATPIFSGVLSTSVSFITTNGVKNYRSDKIRYRTTVEDGDVVIGSPYLQKLAASVREVPLIGRVPDERFFAATDPIAAYAFAAATGDPPVDLDNFAQANAYYDSTEAVYLTSAQWAWLTSQSYSEQISSDGTTAEVVVDPISATNPYGTVRLYLNGVLVVSVNPQYEPATGGMEKTQSSEATYDYYGGGQTSTGTRVADRDQPEEMMWTPNPQSELDHLYQASLPKLMNVFLPKMAYAQQQDNCGYYMRNTLISLAMMAWSGRKGDVLGFIASWLGVVNSVHSFAKCKERNAH